MRVRRAKDCLGFVSDDCHLFLFRPHQPGGNYSAWGFHLRLRRRGEWRHLMLRLHAKPLSKERLHGARGFRVYEVAHWRSRFPTNKPKRPDNRLDYKAYVRIKVCPGGPRTASEGAQQ